MVAAIGAPGAADAINVGANVERLVAGVKAAVDMSDALNGWVLLVLGGTLAVIFSTSYRKPAWPYRAMFVLLLPAIGLLATSMVFGSRVRQAYPPMFLRKDATVAANDALVEINRSLGTQIQSFRIAMLILAASIQKFLLTDDGKLFLKAVERAPKSDLLKLTVDKASTSS